MRVPMAVMSMRIGRLADTGIEIREGLGIGRVRSFDDLQGLLSRYADWSRGIRAVLVASYSDHSVLREHDTISEPIFDIDGQSRREVIGTLRAAIDAKLKSLEGLTATLEQLTQR